MNYVLPLFYGLSMGYLGLIAPGMLNMTSLKISLEQGRSAAIKFSFGATIIVFIQAGIALFFADYLVKSPEIIDFLKKIAVVVFFVLSIVFFLIARNTSNPNVVLTKKRFVFKGMMMSSLNMLAIPFYIGLSTYLASIDRITIEHPYIMPFVIGAALGSFLLFYTYILLAKFIIERAAFIAQNINNILSGLFFLLGIFTLIKILR